MKSVDEQFAALPYVKQDLAFPDAFSGNTRWLSMMVT